MTAPDFAALADEGYRQFQSRLIPDNTRLYFGVRLPVLQKAARSLCRGEWREYLAQNDTSSFEAVLLRGLVIANAPLPAAEQLALVRDFLPLIDNWSTCDSFCAALRLARSHPAEVWRFLQPLFAAPHPYTVRFAVVMLLDYFITPGYIDRVLAVLCGLHRPEYYIRMAAAWALSACYVQFPHETLAAMQASSLDDFTWNKTIQKACESRRVSPAQKTHLRCLRRPASP